MAAKAWGGRFQGATDARVELFTESISFDHRLADADITGSQAHARMLAKVGLLTATEAEQIVMRQREREILRHWNLTPHYAEDTATPTGESET